MPDVAPEDLIDKARRRGDFWKGLAGQMEADRDRADKALAQAEQRATALDAVLSRIDQMVTAWEQRLPETISTATAVDAIRTTLERAQTAPPLDHAQQLDRAVAHLRSIPIQCTALTGPVWYGEGWKEAISQLEEYADRVRPNEARPAPSTLRVRTGGSRMVHEAVASRFGLLFPACGVQGKRTERLPDDTPLTCPMCNGTEQPLDQEA